MAIQVRSAAALLVASIAASAAASRTVSTPFDITRLRWPANNPRLRGAVRMSSAAAPSADNLHSISAAPDSEVKDKQEIITPLGPGCTVLVVGATRGIGLEAARQLVERGCKVVATHRSLRPSAALEQLRCDFLRMDVADEDSVRDAAQELSDRGISLTHIFHSAGIYGPVGSLDGKARMGRPEAPPVTKQDMLDVFQVNAVAPLLVAQHFVPLCNATEAVKIPILAILTSKVGSVHDNGSGGAYAYRASKAACNIIAKSLYVDLRSEDRATVVLLHPGYVRTDMTNGKGFISTFECVGGLLGAIEATGPETPFRWVDYKGMLIPW
eukprot:4291343-Pleurochrysis_carterae.AAC.1